MAITEEIKQAVAEVVKKTGFVLENHIYKTLRQDHWSVISGKYYEDDLTSDVREMDLVAYKSQEVKDFIVFTVLMISCKQSSDNSWVFMSRPVNKKDPNVEWNPIRIWSNDIPVQFAKYQEFLKDEYIYNLPDKIIKLFSSPPSEIFAAQELTIIDPTNPKTNQKNGKGIAKNDKNIYSSINSLIKSQAYEMGSLDSRKTKKCVYQFNLLSVQDVVGMYKADLSDTANPIIEETNDVHYLSRYIIKKKEEFNRIRFISKSAFEKVLDDYNELHNYNISFFENNHDSFYKSIEDNPKKISFLQSTYSKEMKSFFYWGNFENYEVVQNALRNSYVYAMNGTFYICTNLPTDTINQLNEDNNLRNKTASVLKKVFHYEKNFTFTNDEDLPF